MYKVKYRKPGQWFFRTLKLDSHQYNSQLDKMMCGKSDGSSYELPQLSKIEIKMSKESLETVRKLQEASKPNVNVPSPQEPDHK